MIIGLTGGSGSGKSTAAYYFKKMGAFVVDADKVGHEVLMKECIKLKIREGFGEIVFDEYGEINRKALGSIVFKDKKKLELLNAITHTPIRDEVLKKINIKGESVSVIDAAALFESNMDKDCDIILAIIAPIQKRIERIKVRDKIDEEMARNRIKSQLSDEEIILRSHFYIQNDKDENTLYEKLHDFWAKHIVGGGHLD